MLILVASGTSTTGTRTIEVLSAEGKHQIRAVTRNPDSDKAKALAALPNVTVVKADFNDKKSVVAALKDVNRAMLVSGAGEHSQFDREVGFIQAATEAGVEGVVRISTGSFLTHPGYTGVYGRAHACIQAYIERMKSPVVDLCPNWYLDNWLGNAGEAKAAGQLTLPTEGKLKSAYIDPRDIGSAAALILTSSADELSSFIAARRLEVHGPALVSFQDKAAALSKAVGYPIKINTIPAAAWIEVVKGFGMTDLFAKSFCDTVQVCGGEKPPPSPGCNTSSGILLAAGWKPKYDLEAWANSDHVLAAFKK